MCECKRNDKYEVCCQAKGEHWHFCGFSKVLGHQRLPSLLPLQQATRCNLPCSSHRCAVELEPLPNSQFWVPSCLTSKYKGRLKCMYVSPWSHWIASDHHKIAMHQTNCFCSVRSSQYATTFNPFGLFWHFCSRLFKYLPFTVNIWSHNPNIWVHHRQIYNIWHLLTKSFPKIYTLLEV